MDPSSSSRDLLWPHWGWVSSRPRGPRSSTPGSAQHAVIYLTSSIPPRNACPYVFCFINDFPAVRRVVVFSIASACDAPSCAPAVLHISISASPVPRGSAFYSMAFVTAFSAAAMAPPTFATTAAAASYGHLFCCCKRRVIEVGGTGVCWPTAGLRHIICPWQDDGRKQPGCRKRLTQATHEVVIGTARSLMASGHGSGVSQGCSRRKRRADWRYLSVQCTFVSESPFVLPVMLHLCSTISNDKHWSV